MPDRYFVFVMPDDPRLEALLNIAIFSLNPREKWSAHVTVAGPFPDRRFFSTPPDFSAIVRCLGVGNFFDSGSAAVYLKAGFEGIDQVWKKPDFKGQRIPHLTLYDGSDIRFARLIFENFRVINPYFYFYSHRLEVVGTELDQFRSDLREGLDMTIMPETTNLQIDDLAGLPEIERLNLAGIALRRARYHLNLRH